MSFFQGSSNVKIYGGEFNEIKGNYNNFDQSRHQSNINSFNTTTHTTLHSGNNNSRVYYGTNRHAHYPDYPNYGAQQAPDAPPGAQGYPPNGNPPSSSMHPMMQPQYLPPGSRTHNIDSFNTRNDIMHNVNNDNSMEFGIPTHKSRKDRRRRRGTQREEDDGDEEERRPHEERPQHPANPFHNPYGPPGQRPSYGPSALSHTMSAQFSQGHVQGMPTDVQKTFEQLMQQVHGLTAPEPVNVDDPEEDSSEEDEEQDPSTTPPSSISESMAHMSLDEDRPAYSRVKSDPQIPLATSPTEKETHPSRPEHVYSESVPVLPEHMKQPSHIPVTSATPPWGSYPAYPPATDPRWKGQQQTVASPTSPSGQSFPTAHQWAPTGAYAPPRSDGPWGASQRDTYSDPKAPPPPPRSGPVFNTILGDYNKVDRTVHTMNIGSGNTRNYHIQDSFNDNSVKTYAPDPAPGPRKQGRRRP